jgi:hypothetical protein
MVAEANVDAAPDLKTGYPAGIAKRQWYYPTDCVWRFGQAARMGTEFYIQQILDEQLFGYNAMNFGTIGSIHLRRLYREGNITMDTLNDDMRGMTQSMSAVVRTLGQGSQVNGTQWYTKTCLGINWPWISFDGAMIILSVIFLVLVSYESRGVERERLWKSSVLDALFCEVDDPIARDVQPFGKEAMGSIAKSTSVCLDPSGQTLKLVAR